MHLFVGAQGQHQQIEAVGDGQDGIRHQCLVHNTAMTLNAGGDALADVDITGIMADMGKYAADPSQTVMFTDVATYLNGLLTPVYTSLAYAAVLAGVAALIVIGFDGLGAVGAVMLLMLRSLTNR